MSNIIQNIKKATIEAKRQVESKIKSLAVDVTVRDSRLDICNQCEHLLQITSQCNKCGCFVKAKTWLPGSSCPINKW
jgi:hypothetical protein